MATTERESFSKEELEKIEGKPTLSQRVQTTARSGADLLPPALAVVLALIFSIAGTDLGQIAGAFLLLNGPKLIATLRAFAPKPKEGR